MLMIGTFIAFICLIVSISYYCIEEYKLSVIYLMIFLIGAYIAKLDCDIAKNAPYMEKTNVITERYNNMYFSKPIQVIEYVKDCTDFSIMK